MEVSESLKNAENSLRDFITYILQKEKGDNWIEDCGVTSDRIDIWKARLETERKKIDERIIEERLLYYADFYDLKTILKANWSGEFSTAFGKWKTMEVFLDELNKYRNPEAHRRDLLDYQKHLVIGISEEIRNKIVIYRSMKEEKSSEDFYPRFERVSDSLGNIWSADNRSKHIQTGNKLHVGDQIDFTFAATDPFGGEIEFGIRTIGGSIPYTKWFSKKEFRFTVKEKDVGKKCPVQFNLRSLRDYHAHVDYDDRITFVYEVIPPL